jgi:hypothetical protein
MSHEADGRDYFKTSSRIFQPVDLVMAMGHSVDIAKRCAPLSSSIPQLPSTRYDLDEAGETTHLLRTGRTRVLHWNYPEWRLAVITAVSAFLGKNSGLLLVAISRFFNAGMNISVKLLNSSDDPMPTLEVCVDPKVVIL